MSKVCLLIVQIGNLFSNNIFYWTISGYTLDFDKVWTNVGFVTDPSFVQCLSKSNVCPLFVLNGMLSPGKILARQYMDKLWILIKFGQMLDFSVCLSMSNSCPLYVNSQKLYVGEINSWTIPGQTLDICTHLMPNYSFTGQDLDGNWT